MDIMFLQSLQKYRLFLALVLLCECLNNPALADSGSAQTTMALVVPPNGGNMITTTNIAKSDPRFYASDSNVTVLEQGDQVTYQVWISI
jgi:hypothetical protein